MSRDGKLTLTGCAAVAQHIENITVSSEILPASCGSSLYTIRAVAHLLHIVNILLPAGTQVICDSWEPPSPPNPTTTVIQSSK